MTRVVSRSPRRYAVLVALWGLAWAAVSTAQPDALREAADHIREARWDRAIEVLDAVVAGSPDDVRALNLLGIALSSSGRGRDAQARFEKAVAIDPSFHPALKNLAINEMSLGQVDDALAHFRELLAAVPDDPVAHLALAEAAFADRDFQRAADHYARSRLFEHGDAGLVLKLARSYHHSGRSPDALAVLAKLPVGDPEVDHEAGRLLVEMEEFSAAAKRFDSVRSAAPGDYDAGFNLALAELRSGEPARAVDVLEDMRDKGHGSPELYNLLARAHDANGDVKRAYETLRTAIQIDPAVEAHYVDLVALCLEHRNQELALEIADIAVAEHPRSARLHRQRGIVLAMQGDFDGAKTTFDLAADLSPDEGLSYVALGLVYLQMGHMSEAVETLRQRGRQSPGDALAHWFLGEALYRSGAGPGSEEESEALDALNRAVNLQPDLTQAHLLLAKLLQRNGRMEETVEHLTRVLALDPDNPSATYQLAQAYRKLGKTDEATALFAKVREAKEEDRQEFTRSRLLEIVREGTP